MTTTGAESAGGADLLEVRRLTGPNVLMDAPGAVADVRLGPSAAAGDAAVAAWLDHARRILDAVGWGRRP